MVFGAKAISKAFGTEPFIERLKKHNSPYKNWTYDRPMTTEDYIRLHRKPKHQRTPYYTDLQCVHGPLGPYPPNNVWHNGRPNGFPQTCAKGNPIGHHKNRPRHHGHRNLRWEDEMVGPTHAHPHIHRGHSRAPRHFHGPRYEEFEETEYEDDDFEDEDDDFIDDLTEDYYSDDRPPSFTRTRHGSRRRALPPHRGYHAQHGHYLQHPDAYHHGGGHDPFAFGYNTTRVPGYYSHDPYRTRGSFSTESY